MIVRDAGDAWQVVLQTDHADLSGAFARAWADRAPRHESLVLAAERHDDGWAVWEQSPLVDAAGAPVNFLDVQVPAHLAFYRAGIAAVTDEDPYAGLLVSMHGSGIYRQRYGEDPGLRLTHAAEVAALVEEFVAEQEASVPARMEAAGVDDDFRWADYRRLQAYDRLSLLFCMRDLERERDLRGRALPDRAAWGMADRCRAVPAGRRPVHARARPPPRAEAGVDAGRVPGAVPRAATGAGGDRRRAVTEGAMDKATEGLVEVGGVRLWHRITGEGEPVVQIHGAGFGHFNFDPVTPALAERFRVVDYDMRGYGQSDRPVQHYDMEVWADDLAGLMDALGLDSAHVHGTSMGGMIAIVFAGKYPERTTSVVVNCAAAKLGATGRLIFKNWIDIARLDPDGPGSRVLAELITWQALSKTFLAEQGAEPLADSIQTILRDSNDLEVFTAACQAMCDMDLRPWLGRITSPALVLGGDEDLMTPWDQGPDGAGQQAIADGIAGVETHVIRGSNHSTIFDNTAEHARVVTEFFTRHSSTSG